MNLKKTLSALFLMACAMNSYAHGDQDTYTIPIGTKCISKDTRHCTDACKSNGFEKGICKFPNPNIDMGRCYCRYY
ncbi:Uncharacterised protein [Legionella londiniensis]|uniref:Uncharacterized protein n=1 Tax=Legionella londiniensis TaxID=45068 RepID=A0A0W0VMB4_9GAMM|nr:hypothetical protein Llon_1380 [Legionella londiniensis]STX93308.1 Uncharacterised protein [Legionella londiniensis]